MRKVARTIATVILLIAVMILSVGCSKESNEQQSEPEYEDVSVYYGCPNSKNVRKLNLFKKKYI